MCRPVSHDSLDTAGFDDKLLRCDSCLALLDESHSIMAVNDILYQIIGNKFFEVTIKAIIDCADVPKHFVQPVSIEP